MSKGIELFTVEDIIDHLESGGWDEYLEENEDIDALSEKIAEWGVGGNSDVISGYFWDCYSEELGSIIEDYLLRVENRTEHRG